MIYGSACTTQERMALKELEKANVNFEDFLEVDEDCIVIAGYDAEGLPVLVTVLFSVDCTYGEHKSVSVVDVDVY